MIQQQQKHTRAKDTFWFDSNHNWLLKFYCSVWNEAPEIENEEDE